MTEVTAWQSRPQEAMYSVVFFDALRVKIREGAIFVAVLGASNYTYCDATWSQTLPDWIGSHVRALEFFGGVPAMLVYDYVARHIIVILCPLPLCGTGWAAPVLKGGARAEGHIRIRENRAISISRRPDAKRPFGRMLPRIDQAGRIRRRQPPSFGC